MRKIAFATLALLAGCTVGPDYRKPEIATPPSYVGTTVQAPLSMPTASESDLSQWWLQFHDPELDTLVGTALHANLDLLAAVSRVREAREQEIVAGAPALPHVTATGTAIDLHSNADLGANLGFGAPAGSGAPPAPGSTNIHLYSAGFDATWEPDFFGGARRAVEAAAANSEAARWEMRDGEVSLTAEIGSDYLALREAQLRTAILNEEANRQRSVLNLTAARRRAGFVTQLDVNQQNALIASTQSQVPALDAQAKVMEHALAVLLAEEPAALTSELDRAGVLPAIPSTLPIGIPSDLLRRRPDIRQAERKLAAANAEIGVAVADLYPKLDLIAALSVASSSVGGLFSTNNLSQIGIGSIMWPILKGGEIHANIRAREEERKQAYYAWQKAVLGAIQNAEDSLTRFVTEQRRYQILEETVKADSSSAELATWQYRAGLVNDINVLTAQSNLLSARDQLAQSDAALATDLVSVYKALGGGWQTDSADESPNPGLLDRALSQ